MSISKPQTAENKFFNLFKKIAPGIIDKDYLGYPCITPDENLLRDDNCKQLLFEYCYIPYEEKYFRYFDAGYKVFAEFVTLWHYFFRDLKIIDSIIEADKKFKFTETLFAEGMFAILGSKDDAKLPYEKFYKKNKLKISFSFYTTPWQYNQIDYLMKKFSYEENIVGQIIVDYLLKSRKVRVCTNPFTNKYEVVSEFDAFIEHLPFLKDPFSREEFLSKLQEEGFMPNGKYFGVELVQEQIEKGYLPSADTKIIYSRAEKSLEWKDGEFQIFLPRTMGDVYNLNHVLFRPTHADLNDNVREKWGTEVYLKNGAQYRLLMKLEDTGCCFIVKNVWLLGYAWYGINRYEYDFIMRWCKEKCIMIDWDSCNLNDFVY